MSSARELRRRSRWLGGLTGALALMACAPGAQRITSRAPPITPETRTPAADGQMSAAPGSFTPRITVLAASDRRAPLQVRFTAQVSGGSAVSWQFADGETASGAEVSHVFYRPGPYRVRATVVSGGHTYTAAVPLDVQSGGPERAVGVLLQDSGSLALSAQGSVVYAPYTPRFTLDDQPAAAQRQAVGPGSHTVQVIISADAGPVRRSYQYRSGPALTGEELSRTRRYEAEVLRLTNEARAEGWDCARQQGGGRALGALRADVQLQVAARAQSVGMALNGYFAHRSAVDGSLPDDRVRASGYAASSDAENIAAGQPGPAEVVAAWKKSPGHCANLMGDYNDLGVAYVHHGGSPFGEYWTQVFGRK